MTAGLLITFGVLLALVLVFAVLVPLRRARRLRNLPPVSAIEGVSAETLARARRLVANGRIVLAAKAIRDETGWDLERVRDVVDALRAEQPRRRNDGFGHFGGF